MDEEKVVGQEEVLLPEPPEVNAGTVAEPVLEEAEKQVFKKSEKKAGKRIGYYYIIIKSLKESRKNDVVKCFYIKGLTKWGYCVIKEGSCGESKDESGRDIKDRLLWQEKLHAKLQGKVKIPKLLGSFEENGNYYLVIEHLRGKIIGVVCRDQLDMWSQLDSGTPMAKKFVRYIIKIIDVLAALHANGVVHRDATTNNFMIMPFGKIGIIDMELSYDLDAAYPTPPFRLGTYGFMSPQQEAALVPTVKEDVYALGAVMLQILTGISAIKLTGGTDAELERRVNYLVRDAGLAKMIISCLVKDPLTRPSLAEVRAEVLAYYNVMKRGKRRLQSQPKLFTDSEIKDVVQRSIDALATPMFCDSEKGWFAEDMNPVPGEGGKMQKNWYASYSRGVSGIIYFLAKAKGMGFDVSANEKAIEQALNLIDTKYTNRPDKFSPGLHFGADGIAACLAEAIKYGLLPETPLMLERISSFLSKQCGHTGINSGVAGQGLANILCMGLIPQSEILARLKTYSDLLLNAQHEDGSWFDLTVGGKRHFTMGLGNGVSGNLYFLLTYARLSGDAQVMNAATKGLDWLMSVAKRGNDGTYWMYDKKKPLGNWWEDGGAGIALVFIRGYELTGNVKYKEVARRGLHRPPQDILYNGLAQFRGLSGLGEMYLEAYRVFHEKEWLLRGSGVAQVVMHLKNEDRKYGPFWLVRHEREAVGGFMTGCTGVLHFLSRYLNNSEAYGLPLFP